MSVQIKLDNPHKSYFSGQTVEGRVIIQNHKPDTVKSVTVFLKGRGRVSWTDHYGQTHVYRSKTEKYVTISSLVAQDGVGDNLIVLPEGSHSYPFTFLLPTNLPSSFKGKHSKVVYYISVVRNRPLPKLNDRTRLPFTVNGIYDLNIAPEAGTPQDHVSTKGSNSFLLRKGDISLKLHLPRSGFVPGEALTFRADMSNTSNKRVYKVKAVLRQVAKLRASKYAKKTVKSMVSLVEGPVLEQGGHQEVWTSALPIPPLPPTELGGECRGIIDLQYYLYLKMNIDGMSKALSALVPVMIGTIPLRSTFGNFRKGKADKKDMVEMEKSRRPSTSNEGSTSFTSPIPDYPDLPPPSYAEAVALSDNFTGGIEGASSDDDEDESDDGASICSSKQDNGTLQHDDDDDDNDGDDDNFEPNYITYNRVV